MLAVGSPFGLEGLQENIGVAVGLKIDVVYTAILPTAPGELGAKRVERNMFAAIVYAAIC